MIKFARFFRNGIICMAKNLLLAIVFLLIGVLLLSVSIWIRPNGKFPNIHVGKNPAMRRRGIGCVEEQDAQAQFTNRMAVSERGDKYQTINNK